jgi:hypothetical protein
MDQSSIVFYLGMKAVNITEIHSDLVDTITCEGVRYSTVASSSSSPSFAASACHHPEAESDPELTDEHKAILRAWKEPPCASVQYPARATGGLLSRLCERLTKKIGSTAHDLCWTSVTVSDAGQPKRAEGIPDSEISDLRDAQHPRRCYEIMALDEARFCFQTECEAI